MNKESRYIALELQDFEQRFAAAKPEETDYFNKPGTFNLTNFAERLLAFRRRKQGDRGNLWAPFEEACRKVFPPQYRLASVQWATSKLSDALKERKEKNKEDESKRPEVTSGQKSKEVSPGQESDEASQGQESMDISPSSCQSEVEELPPQKEPKPLEKNKENLAPKDDNNLYGYGVSEMRPDREYTLHVHTSLQMLYEGIQDGVPFLRFVLDPQSYPRTTLNILSVSYLIRVGLILETEADDGEMLLVPMDGDIDEEEDLESLVYPAYFSLSRDVWEKLVFEMRIGFAAIPPFWDV